MIASQPPTSGSQTPSEMPIPSATRRRSAETSARSTTSPTSSSAGTRPRSTTDRSVSTSRTYFYTLKNVSAEKFKTHLAAPTGLIRTTEKHSPCTHTQWHQLLVLATTTSQAMSVASGQRSRSPSCDASVPIVPRDSTRTTSTTTRTCTPMTTRHSMWPTMALFSGHCRTQRYFYTQHKHVHQHFVRVRFVLTHSPTHTHTPFWILCHKSYCL